jgi:hypothetical protein
MPQSREPFFLRMAIWLRGLKRWYLMPSGVEGSSPSPTWNFSLLNINIIVHLLVTNKNLFLVGFFLILNKTFHFWHNNALTTKVWRSEGCCFAALDEPQ